MNKLETTRFILKSNEPYNGHLDVDFSQFLDFYSQEDRYLLRHFDTKSLKKKSLQDKHTTFIGLWMNGTCSVDKFKANVIKFVTKL